MAITFPTTLDSFTNPTASTIRHATGGQSVAATVTDIQDAVEALEAKVGVDSSAVATSHDYKLANFTVADITDLTATAAELNILDGATLDVNELNILDGVTSTTAELNILDGVTSTTAELNILDGVTSTTAELNKLDGITGDVVDTGSAQTVTGAKALDGGWSSSGQPFVSVRRSANQSLANTTYTALSFDVEVDDNCSGWASSPNPTRLVAPSAGVYVIIGWWAFSGNTTGTRIAQIRKNNVVQNQYRQQPSADGYATSSLAYIVTLSASDYCELFLYQASGGNLDANGGMAMFKLA